MLDNQDAPTSYVGKFEYGLQGVNLNSPTWLDFLFFEPRSLSPSSTIDAS